MYLIPRLSVLFLLVLPSCTVVPSPNQVGRIQAFDQHWRFAKDLPADGAYEASAYDDSSWDVVTLPHTPRIEPLVVNDQWQGDAWYRKTFTVPASARDKKISVRFEGAMHVADAWLNGTFLGRHLGGYLPFVLDLTDHIRFDGPNILAMKLNNEDNPLVPPGKPLPVLDFNYFGGLYRKAHLLITDRLHITDPVAAGIPGGGGVYVYSDSVTADQAIVHVAVHVRNDRATPQRTVVQNTLTGPDGEGALTLLTAEQALPPGSDHTFTARFRVRTPKRWDTDSPFLYSLTSEVLSDNEPVDRVSTTIGIRDVHVRASGGFQINGNRRYLRGTNRHQEYPYVGYALSDEAQYRDAVKIKQAGFDMVRLSHYPHAEAFMRAADELGLVLMNCIPGWQFFGDSVFQANALQDVRDLARRDRNHASVAFWEVSLNESGMTASFMEQANRTLRAELPGQRVYTAGWIDNEHYDVFIPARQHSRPPDYWSRYDRSDRPIFIAEYGDWEYYAQNAGFNQTEFNDLAPAERTSRQLRAYGEKRLLQQALNYQEAANSNRKGASTFGDANWLMFDYNRGYADDLEASGISDLFRLPKFAHYFYQSQRAPIPLPDQRTSMGPMVHIASYWQPDAVLNVRVFSNCEEVALTLNGNLVARQGPDQNVNTSHLPRPPFTFAMDRFQPGTLRAVGFIDGTPVAEHTVTTAGPPARLALSIDRSGIEISAQNDDVLFVYGRVQDAAGQTVPGDSSLVAFAVSGGGRLIGNNPVQAEAGIATILLRTFPASPTLAIIARADGLQPDTLFINR